MGLRGVERAAREQQTDVDLTGAFQSRIMDYTAALSFIDPDEPYLVSTHVNADGDGVGSILAIREMLVRKKRTCRLVVSDETLNPKFAFLPGFNHIELYGSLAAQPAFSRAIFVDTPTLDPQRVGDVGRLLREDARTMIIDHHAVRKPEGNVRIVDRSASSASELVYGLLRAAGTAIDPAVATQIYTGIAFDTKLFRVSHPERALKVCGELVDFGANPEEIADALFARESYQTMVTLAAALSTLELHFDARVNTLVVDYETFRKGGDLDPVVDHAMAIDGIQAALFFKEEAPGRFRVSLRSRGAVDVNRVAAAFGGGGHTRASGCRIEKHLEEAKRMLLDEVGKQLR